MIGGPRLKGFKVLTSPSIHREWSGADQDQGKQREVPRNGATEHSVHQ